eukprot:Em0110g11a
MRQRKRKLEAIKGNTVKALSFTESYGLTADTLTMHTASAWGMSNFVPALRRFSGDGAKFSRTSNMMILSFCNHTRAAVKGCEDYETITKAFVIGRTFKSFATPYLLKCQFILTLYTRTLRCR